MRAGGGLVVIAQWWSTGGSSYYWLFTFLYFLPCNIFYPTTCYKYVIGVLLCLPLSLIIIQITYDHECNLARYHSALLQTKCWENLKTKQIVYKVIVCECADCHLVEYYIVTYNNVLHHHSAHEKTSLAIKERSDLRSAI